MGNLSLSPQTGSGGDRLSELVSVLVNGFIEPLIMLLYALATLLFFWGLLQFIRNSDSPEERKKGLDHMLWGMVGLVIITTVYGILSIIAEWIGVSLPN